MLHKAIKVIIVTEKLISDDICKLIEECGATGFTLVSASGRGSRDKRSRTARGSVMEDFSNIKIEVIVHDKELAEKITDAVVHQYFDHYCGITYLEEVEILRPQKFWQPEQ